VAAEGESPEDGLLEPAGEVEVAKPETEELHQSSGNYLFFVKQYFWFRIRILYMNSDRIWM
jgi:hypothetical protein